MKAMTAGEFTTRQIPDLYVQLVRADPLTDKPPFFPKDGIPQKGMELLWKGSRVFPPLRSLFATLYTPRDKRLLVFKEVTFEDQMDNLLHLGTMPVVYLVRHPSATVASLLRGQSSGKMPRGRLTVVKSLLEKHDPELAARFANSLDSMDDIQLNALLWRIDTEKAIKAISRHGRGYLLTYEQLCDDAHTHTQNICTEFGIDYHPQMERFLDQLYAGPETDNRPHDVRDNYFTVFRDPRKTKEAWKKNWPAENERKVAAIVSDSITMEQCAKIGGW